MMRELLVAILMVVGVLSGCAASVPESQTTSTYESKPWGELGLAWLKNAPFPDDSRTTGYFSKNGSFPYLGHYDDSTVAMGIPRGYRKGATVDLVLYFHGWSNEAAIAIERYKLGEQLEASGKNAIVMVPQGPKNAQDSSIGKIAKQGGFGRMMDEAVKVLIRDGKLDVGTTLGKVIVSGHSGGYLPVAKCLSVGGINEHIPEVWLWDAAYGEWSDYASFFIPPGKRRFRSFFTDHLEDSNVRIISLLNLAGVRTCLVDEDDLTSHGSSADGFNAKFHVAGAKPGVEEFELVLKGEPIFFMHTHLSHNDVPVGRRYFERLVRESPFLEKR